MKTTSGNESKRVKAGEGLRREYRFDYRNARPNRFAGRGGESVVVLLDPDVARVFKNGESVNSALRAILRAVPGRSASTSGS